MREITFKVTFYCSCRICCGRYSPSVGGAGLTARGNQPIPFGTVAVGDPELFGKWIFFEDLGRWVLASDTGAPCRNISRTGNQKKSGLSPTGLKTIFQARPLPCVGKRQVDVFIGGPNLHSRALELGVQEWVGHVLDESVLPLGSVPGAEGFLPNPLGGSFQR